MAPSKDTALDASAPLLQNSTSEQGANYGGTNDVDAESNGGIVKPKQVEKQHKKFKEIWQLCLGLWTAYVFFSFLFGSRSGSGSGDDSGRRANWVE